MHDHHGQTLKERVLKTARADPLTDIQTSLDLDFCPSAADLLRDREAP
jgi:hypothetical protein